MANETTPTKNAPKAATPTKVPAPAPVAGAPAAPVAEKGSGDLFKAVFADGKAVEPSKKLAPQAMVILNAVRAAGPNGIKRDQLVTNLKGVLVTRQPESRIVTYYQKSLQETGGLVITKSVVPVAAAPATPAAPAAQ